MYANEKTGIIFIRLYSPYLISFFDGVNLLIKINKLCLNECLYTDLHSHINDGFINE